MRRSFAFKECLLQERPVSIISATSQGCVTLGRGGGKGYEMKIIQSAMEYLESYRQAVDRVARERNFLASTRGFPPEETREFVQDIIARNLAQYFAVEGEDVVGWCDIIPRPYEGMEHVGIMGIGVVPEWRNRGVGIQLWQATLEHARSKNGIEKVELEVFQSNLSAVNFFIKAGFQIEGRREKARRLDGKDDNIILMGRFC